jgi:hypothetical protein
VTLLLLAMLAAPSATPETELPPRIHRVILHVPGGPSYGRPENRFVFFTPLRTQALWKERFGTHWIVWTDGSLWARHPQPRSEPSVLPPVAEPADLAWQARIAREAAPVFSQLHDGNADSVGIEVSHSGRSSDPFPDVQIETVVWLLQTMINMSRGRLTERAIFGHKDVDARPAYVSEHCEHAGCAYFVDGEGRAYRRRVDPPESLFRALDARGLNVPRPAGELDLDLVRAEAMGPGRPAEAR